MAKFILSEDVRFPEEDPRRTMHMINFPPLPPPPPPRPFEAPMEAFPPIPPHLRRDRVVFNLDKNDLEKLNDVFMNADTVSAVLPIIFSAPEEIQIVVMQLLNMIEKESNQVHQEKQSKTSDGQLTSHYKLDGSLNSTRWSNPILDENARNLYHEVYGSDCQYYLNVLGRSPFEIAVISRLIAYLESLKTSARTDMETDDESSQHQEDNSAS